jgi:hypothetical protein
MKILIIILLFIGCQRTQFNEVGSINKEEVHNNKLEDLSIYSETIDTMVAFLWPSNIGSKEQQTGLEKILLLSRSLKHKKDNYLHKKSELRELYNINQCPCVLNYECIGNETNLDEERCYEIEESIYTHDRSLIEIYGLVEDIKYNVTLIGGQWLETHLDFQDIPPSRIDFKNMNLHLSALGSYEVQETKRAFSYIAEGIVVLKNKDYSNVIYTIPRTVHEHGNIFSQGSWTIDVVLVPSKNALLFQGELYLDHAGIKRRGFIYWEHPRL